MKHFPFLLRVFDVAVFAFLVIVAACVYGPRFIERGLQRTGTASYLWRFMDKIQLDYELKQRADAAQADIERLQAQMDELRSQKYPSWPRSDGPYYTPNPWVLTNFYNITSINLNVSAGQ